MGEWEKGDEGGTEWEKGSEELKGKGTRYSLYSIELYSLLSLELSCVLIFGTKCHCGFNCTTLCRYAILIRARE